MLEQAHFIGILGAVLYVGSIYFYLFASTRGNALAFAAVNLIAAVLILVGLNFPFDGPFLTLQIALFFIGWLAVVYKLIRHRSIALSVQEKQVADLMFPNLPYRHSLELIRQGQWKTETQTTLADEGKPLENLSLLLSGSAIVEKSGTQVATLSSGQMIGEVSCLENTGATAKVRLDSTAHYFSVPACKLRKFVASNTDAARAFETAVRRQLSKKLS